MGKSKQRNRKRGRWLQKRKSKRRKGFQDYTFSHHSRLEKFARLLLDNVFQDLDGSSKVNKQIRRSAYAVSLVKGVNSFLGEAMDYGGDLMKALESLSKGSRGFMQDIGNAIYESNQDQNHKDTPEEIALYNFFFVENALKPGQEVKFDEPYEEDITSELSEEEVAAVYPVFFVHEPHRTIITAFTSLEKAIQFVKWANRERERLYREYTEEGEMNIPAPLHLLKKETWSLPNGKFDWDDKLFLDPTFE